MEFTQYSTVITKTIKNYILMNKPKMFFESRIYFVLRNKSTAVRAYVIVVTERVLHC
jgi:hypothetical protein